MIQDFRFCEPMVFCLSDDCIQSQSDTLGTTRIENTQVIPSASYGHVVSCELQVNTERTQSHTRFQEYILLPYNDH